MAGSVVAQAQRGIMFKTTSEREIVATALWAVHEVVNFLNRPQVRFTPAGFVLWRTGGYSNGASSWARFQSDPNFGFLDETFL